MTFEKVGFYVRVSRDDLECRNQWKILGEWGIRNEV
jgi:hypothetical protein